jgi:hypothetical protein
MKRQMMEGIVGSIYGNGKHGEKEVRLEVYKNNKTA